MQGARALASIVLGCLFCFTSISFGQVSDGNIVGTVVDSSGASVPGANIQLDSLATGVRSATKSDANGIYRFGNVLIGSYSITVSATGFTTLSLRDVIVELNKTTTVNARLEIGNVSTTVEVSEATTAVDTTTARWPAVSRREWRPTCPPPRIRPADF